MKSKILVFLLFLCFTLSMVMGQSNPASAAPMDVYLWGTGSPDWTDYDKVYDGYDDPMCWAAATVNVLSWTGWDGGFSDEDAIFNDFRYGGGWTSGGGVEKFGFEWWFTGGVTDPNYPSASPSVFTGGGGYYTMAEYTNSFRLWGMGYDNDPLDGHSPDPVFNMDLKIKEFINGGIGTALDLASYVSANNYLAHAVTLWGYKYDSETGDIIGIYFTDSNDHGDDLLYFDLYYSGTYNCWYVDDYKTSIDQQYDYWINGLEGLVPYGEGPPPDEPVPEPATIFLLGSGLAGLFGFGRRKFKRN